MEKHMGLDNIWLAPNGQSLPPVTFDPPLKLAGGMFTGDADDPDSSFRGKCYVDFIGVVTGADLYDDLDNATVRKVADRLQSFLPHAIDLTRMFRAFGNTGYRLIASF
jgi:hypothetical protein